jgi:SAM-dependent methyltransferase
MSKIDYNHNTNTHNLLSSKVAFASIFSEPPKSLLDVGCGKGTWLKAALDYGVDEVIGVEGVMIETGDLHVCPELIKNMDLRLPWDLKRKFDVVLCLEVAEHLEEIHAESLVFSLANHGDLILFSAACPGQPGQNHVNCQWPEYWQNLFNKYGYVCDDSIRWQIWDNVGIEPWYRQNLFVAKKDIERARKEERIKAVVHPEILQLCINYMNHRIDITCRFGGISECYYSAKEIYKILKRLVKRLTAS